MIIKNTPANRTLARKACEAINADTGFRAIIDLDWNCGEDIRIEIGTVNCPFIVIVSLDENGFDLHLQMTKTDLDIIEIEEMKYRMESLDKIASRLYQLVEEYRPVLYTTSE